MEITVSGQLIAILVSVVGIGVIIIIAIVVAHIALVRRTGKLPTRDEFNALSEKVSDLEVAIAALNVQFDVVNARIDAVNGQFVAMIDAVNARIDALPTQESLDAAIRASEARIIKALINHRHPEPSGAPAFTEPL